MPHVSDKILDMDERFVNYSGRSLTANARRLNEINDILLVASSRSTGMVKQFKLFRQYFLTLFREIMK